MVLDVATGLAFCHHNGKPLSVLPHFVLTVYPPYDRHHSQGFGRKKVLSLATYLALCDCRDCLTMLVFSSVLTTKPC